jgi:hypothetical protein
VSVVSAGCVLWLERFQPAFGSLAICALGYQAWLVWRRPPHRRTSMMLLILWTSLATSLAVGGTLVVLSLRYW